MRSGNRIEKLKQQILGGLAGHATVRIECARPRKMLKELRKQLQMCEIELESEEKNEHRRNHTNFGRPPPKGVLVVSWKSV